MSKSVLAVATATLLGAASFTLSAPTALASATGCKESYAPPNSCIHVEGAHTYVDYANGGVRLLGEHSIRGFFTVFTVQTGLRFADGRDSNAGGDTSTQTYTNNGYTAAIQWGPNVAFNKELPPGTEICAGFHEVNSSGDVVNNYGDACETVGG